MRANDRLGAAEALQRLRAQRARARAPLLLPESLDHELEVRRLDPALVRLVRRQPTPCVAEVDLAGGRLLEHRLHQRRLDLDRLAGELVVALDRLDDRIARRTTVEVVEPQVVREEVRDPALEAVELGERVVAEREQDTNAETGARDELGQLVGKAGLLRVVEEVLLGLVEDQQQVTGERVGPAPERLGERLALALVEERRARIELRARRARLPGGFRPDPRSRRRRRRPRTRDDRVPRRCAAPADAGGARHPRAAPTSSPLRSARRARSAAQRGGSRR